MIVNVPVSDVAAAVRFYCEAFSATVSSTEVSGAVHVELGSAVLRVCDEASHVADRADARHYNKGSTPRLELRVDAVQAWIDRATSAGARLCARLPVEPAAAIRYAQILDPFGHLWSFAFDG
jgi:uncharacterized glyoxalase superfamily protein PhnB